jgi:putative acetyltransferase
MQIREIDEKDNPVMEKIIKQSLESYGLHIPGTAYYDPYLGELAQFYEQERHAKYWVVADKQDVAVGGVGIGPFGDHVEVGELQKLYIAPKAQGKGLAKKLMKVALDFAKEHYSYCYLETFEKLSTANRLYEKFGFNKLDHPLEGSEHNACDTWYIKEL